MIKLHYYVQSKTWSLSEDSKPIYMGKNNIQLTYHKEENPVSFFFTKKGDKVGPIVGILTSNRKNQPIAGNLIYFRQLMQAQKYGLIIVFTPDDLYPESVVGYTFLVDKNKWVKVKTPLPDIVYNRIPFRKLEGKKTTKACIAKIKEKNIPFFNPSFFNKWDTYLTLAENDSLKMNLPATTKWINKESLIYMLSKYSSVYVKPILGHKGSGIFTISASKSTYMVANAKQKVPFHSFQDMYAYILEMKRNKAYIIQEKIPLEKHDSFPYDFRVLSHYINGTWELTGIGIRQAGKNSITTHVPKGGTILSKKEVPVDTDVFGQIVNEIGRTLRKSSGDIREISVDIGRTERNHYYIFEVNSKPMKFDEEEIEERRLQSLTKIFNEESGFSI